MTMLVILAFVMVLVVVTVTVFIMRSQKAPVDCQVSNWSNWDTCNKTCGGTQSRIRTVTRLAKDGGLSCPALIETQACNTQTCVDLGIGTVIPLTTPPLTTPPLTTPPLTTPPLTTTPSTTTPPLTTPPLTTTPSTTTPSTTTPSTTTTTPSTTTTLVPVNCQVGDWSNWDTCSKTCGGGTQSRTRTVTTQPQNGGATCPTLSESRECNTQACDPCPSDLNATNLSTACINKLWRDAGCTTSKSVHINDAGEVDNWAKNQTKQGLIDDYKAWSTKGVSQNRDMVCYNQNFTTPTVPTEPDWVGSDWFDGTGTGCTAIGKRMIRRQVDAKNLNWDNAAQTMKSKLDAAGKIESGKYNNKVIDSTSVKGRIGGAIGIDVEAIIKDDSCDPGWIGDDWFDGVGTGCTAVGKRDIRRQVDARGIDWTSAAQYMKSKLDVISKIIGGKYDNKVVDSTSIENRIGGGIDIRAVVQEDKCNPIWVRLGDVQTKSLWDNHGCQPDGTRKYTRQFNTQGLDSTTAGTYMLTLVPEPNQNLFNFKVSRRAIEGDRIAMFLNEDCFDYSGVISRESCAAVGKRTVAKECLNWPAGWTSVLNREQLLTTCEPKKPVGSTVNVYGTQVWAKWQVNDDNCNPTWVKQGDIQTKSLWDNNGCQPDGNRRYAREVNTQGIPNDQLQSAMNYMLELVPKEGETLFGLTVKRRTTEGRWIIMYVQEDCFVYTGSESREQCHSLGKRIVTKQCLNWPAGWVASNEVVDKCQVNKPSGSTVEWLGAQVWAKQQVDDDTCNPSWIANKNWEDKGCKADGTREFVRQVNVPIGSWEEAAEYMRRKVVSEGSVNGKSIVRSSIRNYGPTIGIYVVVNVRDNCPVRIVNGVRIGGNVSGDKERQSVCMNLENNRGGEVLKCEPSAWKQQFYLEDNGLVKVRQDYGNNPQKCLDVRNAGTSNGTRIDWADCWGGENQKWNIDDKGRLIPRHATNMCISVKKPDEVRDGSDPWWQERGHLHLWNCDDTNQQFFTVTGPITSHHGDNKCIDNDNGGEIDGNKTQIWTCAEDNKNQYFWMDKNNRLINIKTGKCLDVSGGGQDNGSKVHQWTCHDGDNQRWDYDDINRLRPRHATNKCLDIVNQSTNDGAGLHIWDCGDQNSQKFTIPGRLRR